METDPKQCADKHLGTTFRKRGNPLYLAVVIGRLSFGEDRQVEQEVRAFGFVGGDRKVSLKLPN
jgi:hypothetical protein